MSLILIIRLSFLNVKGIGAILLPSPPQHNYRKLLIEIAIIVLVPESISVRLESLLH